jgi:hypothetical protein
MYNLEMKIKDVTEVIEKIQLLSWKIYGNVKWFWILQDTSFIVSVKSR